MKNVLVIDGFYEKPEAVREFALNCEWIDRKTLSPNFPGTESKKCFYSPSSVNKLGKLIGLDVQPERFNRLVLFRGGHLFHAPDRYFGTAMENGRLVQLFFFRELRD